MKKLLSTLPSTKPDHFTLSQTSEVETNRTNKPNYTSKLQGLTASMTEVIKMRSVLLLRDVQSLYSKHQQFLSQFLQVRNLKQFWELTADKKDSELNQQKQISLMVKILQKLNKKRIEAADEGNSYLSDQYRKTIELFISDILKYQSILAKKKQSQALSRLSEKGKLRRLSYQFQEKKVVGNFEQNDRARQQQMLNRFKREQQLKQKEVIGKINQQIYKINPSSLTQQAKQKSLMKKVGPYRLNKSNPFEDKGYTHDIKNTLHEEQIRRMTVVDHYKKVERQKLMKQQSKLFETQQIYWDHQRNKMQKNLDSGRTELQYNQKKIKENMLHSLERSRKRKLTELKKTLDAYIKHQDSIKIKEVLIEHEQKIRHTTDLREIALSQRILKHMPGRYSTICGKVDFSADSQAKRHERYFQSRIHKILKQDNEQKQFFSARKSLVEMYDNSLTPI